MAVRKLIFINQTEGYTEEFASTGDEFTVGKATFTGVGGVAVDAGGQSIINVADPTAATDAANKQYVDAVASGLDMKGSCRVATTANLTATAAGTGVGKTLTNSGTQVALAIDGVTLAVNDRVLVKDQTAADDNGIYKVTNVGSGATNWVITRATDFDQDAEVTAGSFTFVTEGSISGDTGWVLTTDDPITVDTTNLAFAQFSSTVAYTFDHGLSLTSGSVKIELDTAANAQGAGAGGGSSGLEFDVNSAAGKVRAAVHATGGLERTATGLAAKLLSTGAIDTGASGLFVKIDDTPDTLDSGANGLKVVGLPSLFKINGTAVGANVTAPNLDTLTGGGNADALHIHAESARVENSLPVDEAVAVADPVAFSTVNDRVLKARGDSDAKSRVIGLARTAQAVQGNTAEIVTAGIAVGTLTGATVNTPYYLGATGGISTSMPGAGNRLVQVGVAKNATDLFVRVIDYGKKAA
jgi:hypothetical protein